MSTKEVEDAVQRERERCAALCRRRSQTWRTTSLATSAMPSARDEARARANEAAYLADLIESGEDPATSADA
jgi:hypothetical protein